MTGCQKPVEAAMLGVLAYEGIGVVVGLVIVLAFIAIANLRWPR